MKDMEGPPLAMVNKAMDVLEQRHDFQDLPEEQATVVLQCLGEFSLYQRTDRVSIEFGTALADSGQAACVLCIIAAESDVPNVSMYGGTHCLREVFPACFIRVPRPVGRVTMRPETWKLKLTELMGVREVDFRDHPRFSRRYFVLASDEKVFRTNIDRKLLDLIGEQEGLFVEIQDVWLTACLPETLSTGSIIRLAEFAVAASSLK